MTNIKLDKYVVSNGTNSIGYDDASGGYPYQTRTAMGHIFPSIKKALAGLEDATGVYVRMSGSPRIYRVVLEEVDVSDARAEESKRIAEEKLKELKALANTLSPEDIAYIKNNF